ncbi:YggT family protein [Mesorhizobium australicum]|uniref:YggT family protein n=2 Tax=Mesorhizobium australicum TaxID=536018 RepID=A0A1X7PW31_9HYPH|nr:YggT family protein [Mesorhizobium australicum]
MAGIYVPGPGSVKRVTRRIPAALAASARNGYICPTITETFMLALIQTIILALDIYWWLIILSAIFSWLYAFNVINSRNQFVGMVGDFLYKVTEPALRPIRRFLPDLGGIDISPIILLLILFFIRQLILQTVAPALLS